MSRHIEIVEVGPRDGIQSQPKILDTETKVEFVNRLVAAGVRRIEVASFVNPKRVPQMQDVDAVIAALPKRPDVTYVGLVMNKRGFERALAAGIDEINCVVVMTDSFSQRNQGATLAETLISVREIASEARAAALRCGVTLAAAFGCPYEGEVPVDRVVDVAGSLAAMGFGEIAVADTIGVAGPSDVAKVLREVRKVTGEIPLRCHFHNTRNTAVANAYVAIEEGVNVLDASCGGVGGCPFAPAATGNVATEDLLYMIERMGLETGISIGGIMETARWLEGQLGVPMPAMVTRAGLFPARAGA